MLSSLDRKPNSTELRVAVLFGGRSGEHTVSIASAESVLKALSATQYESKPVYLDQQGIWYPGVTPSQSGDLSAASAINPSSWLIENADIVFPVLHGTYGEDGAMQGLLEVTGVPYVGSGVVGSAVAMDKAIFKCVMQANGFDVLPWHLVTSQEIEGDSARVVERIESKLQYPIFTKPANLGSSVGVSRCINRKQLKAGLAEASRYDRRVVVEQGIDPRELEVAVLGNDVPQASIVGEIRPQRDFYDYTAKYVSGDSTLLIPAPLDEGIIDEVKHLAVMAYEAIDASGLARVDLFLDESSNVIYVNEINTIPGFTEISMFPKLWEATGVSYAELLDRVIQLGLRRHQESSRLRRAV